MHHHTHTYLNNDVLMALWVQVEVSNFWAEASRHSVVHLITSVNEALSQLHMALWESILHTQGQCSREEAHQVILKNSRQSGNSSSFEL